MIRAVVDEVLQHLPEGLRLSPPVPPRIFDRARDTVRTSGNDKVVTLPGRAPDTAQKSAEPAEPA